VLPLLTIEDPEEMAMRQWLMSVVAISLSTTLFALQPPSSRTSAQTPASQNSTETNPQSPTTPLGSPSAQNSPAPANNQQPSARSNEPNSGQNSSQSPTANGAQTAQPEVAATDQVPSNTELHAALDTPLSTRTSKPGDRFTATVTDPVRASNGSVVLPAGARIEGEVAEDEAIPALRDKTQLTLRFRDVVLPNGQTLPLTATLISVNKTNAANTKKSDEETHIQSGTRGKDVAQDVGTGAGAGTPTELTFGTPLKGMAVGALAGGGYVLATKAKQVNLPAQTGMVIRIDQPLSGAEGLSSVPR
jgi:hypothetical protein